MSLIITEITTLTKEDTDKLNLFINELNNNYNLLLELKSILYNSKAYKVLENYNIQISENIIVPIKRTKTLKALPQYEAPEVYKDEKLDTENNNYIEEFPEYKPTTLMINKENFYLLDDTSALKDITNTIIGDLGNVKKEKADDLCFRDKDSEFEILNHQKIVQRYLNTYTPYRGLLLYHGLGSGKTCSSISILEGMKEQNKIYIMTPASLQKNYKTQLTFCGDNIFKLNNRWAFQEINKENIEKSIQKIINTIKKYLYLTTFNYEKLKNLIEKQSGFWFIKEGEHNYNNLKLDKQRQISNQISELIDIKYNFINYNGLTLRKYLTKYKTKDVMNPFDNSTVVIDEVHNLVSRIINKINKDKKIDETKSVSEMIYEDLMSAENCKIVALTGTPYINNPTEIGVLINIISGYTVVIEYKLEGIYKTPELKKYLSKIDTIDLIEYNATKSLLSITRNPYYFKKMETGIKYDNTIHNLPIYEYKQMIEEILIENKVKINDKGSNVLYYKPLPDTKVEFEKLFVKNDNGKRIINNKQLFLYKLLGRVSYFGDKKSLMPSIIKTKNNEDLHIEICNMSTHQLSIYNKYNKGLNDKGKKESSYMIFSRAACNFTFLEEHKRPIPAISEVTENILDLVTDEIDSNEKKLKETEQLKYKNEIIQFMKVIKKNKNIYFNNDLLKYVDIKFNIEKGTNGLRTFSEKYYKILENIVSTENDGCQLLYSNFRMIEGIGIMRQLLKYQGFRELIVKKTGNSYTINLEGDYDPSIYKKNKLGVINKNVFALYTGTEEEEEKEIIRNIYNSNIDKLPPEVITRMREIYGDNYGTNKDNIYGNIIKLLMITSSGAEGIDLKNTRTVHITEPYWHNVRIDQVIGRARRICSHYLLPKDKQTVKVYLYISRIKDETKKISADESLYNIMISKKTLSDSFLNALKEIAIDCKSNCYKLPLQEKTRTIEKSIEDIVKIKKKII